MFSEWLDGVLMRSGMSRRPEFYSGRGARLSDLDDERLESIWSGIRAARGGDAAQAFALMVASMPEISATDFLLALSALEGNAFAWDAALLPKAGGVYATDPVSAMCTVADAGRRGGDTLLIRGRFLKRHGIDHVDAARDPYAPINPYRGRGSRRRA